MITVLEAESTLLSFEPGSGLHALGQQPSHSEGPWEPQSKAREGNKGFQLQLGAGSLFYSVKNVECGDLHKADLINSVEWSFFCL